MLQSQTIRRWRSVYSYITSQCKQPRLYSSKNSFINSVYFLQQPRNVHFHSMASSNTEISVSEDVTELIKKIITENDWEPVSEVRYVAATEGGEGFSSKHIQAEINKSTGKLNLFVKCPMPVAATGMPMEKLYDNEIYFYNTVYNTYFEFLKSKGLEKDLEYVPKCYDTSTKHIIALENLKDKGFSCYERMKIMDDDHITLAVKTLAKFHGISFAHKDQNEEENNMLVDSWDGDLMSQLPKDSPIAQMMIGGIQHVLKQFDPVKDKDVIERADVNVLIGALLDVTKIRNRYTILTQGDFWCNNIMFSYENETKSTPIDIKIVDWQQMRPTSPVIDLSYFLYTISSKESLAKTPSYLELYYKELSEEIKKLGSDPEVCYPKSVFDQEWKERCKFGFTAAFMLLRLMLISKNDVPDMENIDLTNMSETERVEFLTKMNNVAEIVGRLRVLGHFMVDNDYI